jgi:hypothetical protein
MKSKRVLIVLGVVALLWGCASSEQAGKVETTGFLKDYSKLRPGEPGEPLLFYRNPKVDWREYDKAMVDPVTIWRGEDSNLGEIPPRDLQRLTRLMRVKAIEAVRAEGMQVVDTPGPRVMRIRVALTEAEQASRAMHAVTSVVPLPSVSKMATGTRAFVGSAGIEGEVSDSVTGEVLMEGVDRRGGGRELTDVRNPWSHVEKAFQYWSDRFRQRLCEERGGKFCVPAE